MALQIGEYIGQWRLLYAGKNRHRQKTWLCQCVCLLIKAIEQHNLIRGKSKSCGCWRGDLMSQRPEYIIWRDMLGRCLNPKNPGFQAYGGRGITIDESWQKSFRYFFADVGHRPSPEHSIERINNDAGYFPGNVRWATRTEQGRNRRSSRYISCFDHRMTLIAWAECTSIPAKTIARRLNRGWTTEQALTTPVISGQERARRLNEQRWGHRMKGNDHGTPI